MAVSAVVVCVANSGFCSRTAAPAQPQCFLVRSLRHLPGVKETTSQPGSCRGTEAVTSSGPRAVGDRARTGTRGFSRPAQPAGLVRSAQSLDCSKVWVPVGGDIRKRTSLSPGKAFHLHSQAVHCIPPWELLAFGAKCRMALPLGVDTDQCCVKTGEVRLARRPRASDSCTDDVRPWGLCLEEGEAAAAVKCFQAAGRRCQCVTVPRTAHA